MSHPTVVPGSPPRRALAERALPLAVLLLSLAAAMIWQHRAVAELWRIWFERPEYSHGMLLPILAAMILWKQRTAFELAPAAGSWTGVLVLLAGGVLAWLGDLATLYVISQYGLAIMVCGVLIAWIGVAAARRSWVVFVLLLLAIPPPNFLLNALSFDMQLLSSRLGVLLTRPLGISVFVEGNLIDLGGQQLQVAEACDGLRYLFPLLTIGFLVAYLANGPWWKRALIFVVSIPLAIGMNALRVASIILLVERWGIGMAEGFLHDLQGWVMFMISAGLLYLFAARLVGRRPGVSLWRGAPAAPRPAPDARLWSRPRLVASVLPVLLLVAGLVSPERVDAVPPRAHLSEWPLQVGDWRGSRDSLDSVYLDVLQLTDYLLADYSDGARGPVNLYVAYYDSQRSGASAHSPRSCIPGGGWEIRSIERVTLDHGRVVANRVLIEHGLQKQVVYYWFAQRGRVLTNEYLVKWYIFWDALTRQRTDGALVRISAPVHAGQSLEDVDRAIQEFAETVVPRLGEYVPG